MAAPGDTGHRAAFQATLAQRNFGTRCHELAALGKALGATAKGTSPSTLEALLDELAGDPGSTQAFEERCRLIVAKAAGCTGYAKKLLYHNSQTVRVEAVRGSLLSTTDAQAAFISDASSRKLKKLLIGSKALRCSASVVDHAWQLFGVADQELVWKLLVKAEEEMLLRTWLLDRNKMGGWFSTQAKSPPGLPGLAQRFPLLMIDLVKELGLKWGWYWAKDMLQTHSLLVLRTTLLDGFTCGTGPHFAYLPTRSRIGFWETLASWGWRHRPTEMLDLCRELAAKTYAHPSVQDLAEKLMENTSTRFYLTTTQKINYLVNIWSQLPAAQKNGDQLSEFVAMLPKDLKEHRVDELNNLVAAFWKIVADVGRSARRELLVGQEAQPKCTQTWTTFAKKLPPPVAVDQFFRVLQEFDAACPTYKFMIESVCASEDGRHDRLLQRIYERYLKKDGMNAVRACSMFQVFLDCARSRDVIQSSFDMLLQHLGGKMELGLLQRVVSAMHKLEVDFGGDKASCTPQATMMVPVQWPRLVRLPPTAAPHSDFLLAVLHSGIDESQLLGKMLGKYGASFFWDSFAVVLEAARAGTGAQAALQRQLPHVNVELLKQIDLAGFATPIQQPGDGSGQGDEQASEVVSVYFTGLEETKRKTLGKDSSQRQVGYVELMTLAQKDADPSKAFADLLPFLVGRFGGEQESVKSAILRELLVKKRLPFKLWEESLHHFRNLWKICCKARDREAYSKDWCLVGSLLVEQAVREWPEGAVEPSEAGLFGLEALEPSGNGQDLPKLLVKVGKSLEKGVTLKDEAVQWVFEKTVPLSSEKGVPGAWFWTTLDKLAELVPQGKGAARTLWDRHPFISKRWRELLAEGIKQKAVDFSLVGVVDLLTRQVNAFSVEEDKDRYGPAWWAPLECKEYGDAVRLILDEMESGEIPTREASSLLARRVLALVHKEAAGHKHNLARQGKSTDREDYDAGMPNGRISSDWRVWGRRRRPKVEELCMRDVHLLARQWVADEHWDVPKHHLYDPVPFATYRCRDSVAGPELAVFLKLLTSGRSRRHVLWQVVDVASTVTGPETTNLVGEAIAGLDARQEGMARCMARHYPYLNAALTNGEKQDRSCDVLTPLVELWLLDDGPRDGLVGQLMKRPDFQYFLFFGTSFARHLSNARQEWLHQALERLTPPGQGELEFYHYPRRGPILRQVAQLGSAVPGWRKTLALERGDWQPAAPSATRLSKGSGKGKCKGKGKGRRAPVMPEPVQGPQGPGGVQVYLWHPDTQAAFLQKALYGTDSTSLALIPRLEFATSTARAKELLDAYPKEQPQKVDGSDIWGWEVIQAAGAYSDLDAEVQRRFLELPLPWIPDAVGDAELECLVAALGRADEDASIIQMLGRFAGKVKPVKETMTKLVARVSPADARNLIKQVMLPRKSGVALQTAGLRMLQELQIPEPLELYRAAWSNGQCPRDVAGIILAKVNASQCFSPEDVRSFYSFFRQMAGQQDECVYVAGLLLTQLMERPSWSLPFLPEVVAELAMLPGLTNDAVQALKTSTSHVNEILHALTKVLVSSRLAERAAAGDRLSSELAAKQPEARVLNDLYQIRSFASLRDLARSVGLMQLADCDPDALLGFVGELLRAWQGPRQNDSDSLLDCTLAVWAKLLRPGQLDTWPAVLTAMEKRLARCGSPRDLGALVAAIVAEVSSLSIADAAQHGSALAIVREMIQRLLSEHLAVPQFESKHTMDSIAKAEMQKRCEARNQVVLKQWPALLANGCTEAETAQLFSACPEGKRVEFADAFVHAAMQVATKHREALAKWRQKRPDQGWRHEGGIPVDKVQVGSEATGRVTNSSAEFGVFINFGCVKDGRLNVPTSDWTNYRVGDEVTGMIVNKVDIKKTNQFIELILVRDRSSQLEAQSSVSSWQVACRTVQWLSNPPEQRNLHLSTISSLWAKVMNANFGDLSFEEGLGLLGSPLPQPKDCSQLVNELLLGPPERDMARQALDWLGKVLPEDAVRLWTAWLERATGFADTESEAANASDMIALLRLCEQEGLELPKIPKTVARGFVLETLELLAASKMPEARLLALQALWEQHWQVEDLPSVLIDLKSDPCEVVAVAARNLWATLTSTEAFGGQGGQGAATSSDEDSDSENGSEDEETGSDSAADW